MLRLKEILSEKNMSQTELADKMGLHKASITQLLSIGNPRLDTLQKIADTLEVSIVELFEERNYTDIISLIYKGELKQFKTVSELKEFVDSIKE